MSPTAALGSPWGGGRVAAPHTADAHPARRRDALLPPPRGECLGQAPHSCSHGVKGKIILQPTDVLGEGHGLSQGEETIARPACQASTCVWLNLRAVTIKRSLNNERCGVLPTLLLCYSVLLLWLHFAQAPAYFMSNLCCCRAGSACSYSFLFLCS